MKKVTSICMALFLAAGLYVMGQEADAKTEATPKAPDTPATQQPRPPRPNGPNNGARRGPNGPVMMNQEAQLKRLNEEAQVLLQMYDANKDGKLDDGERAKMDADFALVEKLMRYARSKPLIDALDTDKDMKISEAEGKNLQKVVREIMQKRFEQNGGPGARPGRPQMRHDGNPPANRKTPPPPPSTSEQAPEPPPAEQPKQ